MVFKIQLPNDQNVLNVHVVLQGSKTIIQINQHLMIKKIPVDIISVKLCCSSSRALCSSLFFMSSGWRTQLYMGFHDCYSRGGGCGTLHIDSSCISTSGMPKALLTLHRPKQVMRLHLSSKIQESVILHRTGEKTLVFVNCPNEYHKNLLKIIPVMSCIEVKKANI